MTLLSLKTIATFWLLLQTSSAQNQKVLEDDVVKSRPNIVFILTDDQDVQLNSLQYMPLVQKHLLTEGTFFKRHFATVALCCPSRVSLWTGKTAHNTNVTDVNPPYGGYPKFVSQGLNENFLPVWLQEAGYDTYYTGKLFNAHTTDNYNSPHVKGFTGSDFLLDPYTYQYLNSVYQRNHDAPKSYKGHYTTDVLAEKALGFLDDAADSGKPFFLSIAPIAPHSNVEVGPNQQFDDLRDVNFSAPFSADRHKDYFKRIKVPRTPNFNPREPSGVNWVKTLPRQSQENVDYNDHFYRQRLRALQSVDELVEQVIDRLEKHGLLDNTYVFYTADNGYHIGQHRLQPGKECGFEEDINVPLIIRGPGVSRGVETELVTTHTDLSPTILNLIGAKPRPDFDGSPIPVTSPELQGATWHEHVNIEYWGFGLFEGQYGRKAPWLNNTYKALRVISPEYSLYYSVWCSDEHQLYDLHTDPYQINNLLDPERSANQPNRVILGVNIDKVAARLDSLLFVLKSCKGQTCVDPWKALHPAGNVRTLRDALASQYDAFYEEEQVKIKYPRCELGHILNAEGPQFEVDGLIYRHGVRWSEWT